MLGMVVAAEPRNYELHMRYGRACAIDKAAAG